MLKEEMLFMLVQKAARPFCLQNEIELCKYFADVFQKAKPADGAVCIFSDKNNRKNISYVKACEMCNRGPKEISRHDRRDAMFTFSTFCENKTMERTISKISNVFAWSVDVDYKRKDLKPVDVLQYILDTASIPTPNYAECGHRLRLIYLFDEPLRMISGSKSSLLRGFSFMQKCIADLINDAVDWAGAESCPVNSFFRIPGSTNSKTGDVIQIVHLTDERWTMQEIYHEWIPDTMIDKSGCAKVWKDNWKKKKREGNKSWNQRILWENRARKFEDLRRNSDIPREKLCFLYGVSCLQTGKAVSSEDVIKQIISFNEGFDIPLAEKEIRSKFRTIRSYAFKESTIADFLGIEYEKVFDRKSYDAFRYQKKRNEQIKFGYTKQQLLSTRRHQVFDMLQKKMRPAFIADVLGISVSTLKRDTVYIKNHKHEFGEDEKNEVVTKKEFLFHTGTHVVKPFVINCTGDVCNLHCTEHATVIFPLALPQTPGIFIDKSSNQLSCKAAAFSASLMFRASCILQCLVNPRNVLAEVVPTDNTS